MRFEKVIGTFSRVTNATVVRPVTLLLVTLALVGSFTAFAAEPKVTVSGPPFPPFYNPESKTAGVVGIRLCEEMFNDSGLGFELKYFPYSRMLHNVKFGKTDMAFCFKNSSIKDHVDYIGPISKFKILVVTKKQGLLKEYDDLKKLTGIGMIRNAKYSPKFDSDKSLKKVGVESYIQAVNMLEKGRLDAVVGSFLGLKYAFKKAGLSTDFINQGLVINEKEVWLHLSKKTTVPNLKNHLEKRIEKLYKADLLQQIYEESN